MRLGVVFLLPATAFLALFLTVSASDNNNAYADCLFYDNNQLANCKSDQTVLNAPVIAPASNIYEPLLALSIAGMVCASVAASAVVIYGQISHKSDGQCSL